MFPYFTIFNRTVGAYALLSMIGMMVSCFVAAGIGKKYRVQWEDVILTFLAAAGGLFIGGHLLYGFTHLSDLIAFFGQSDALTLRDAGSALLSAFGGMVFYGGFLGGILGILIYSRLAKEVPAPRMLDLYAVCTPLFHVFGRIGCFLGGCCYGIESDFGFTATGNTIIPELNGVSRFPVQLAEAGCNLVIFLILLKLFWSGKRENRLIYVYMLIYPPIRFGLEFLRGDEIRGFMLGLSTSQWISVVLFGIAVVQTIRYQRNKPPTIPANENRLPT
ncbi:MAG: prolipoprotein diacylglyceryl transferase [Eubacteriales bacterium]